MSNGAKLAALNKFKNPTPGMMRQLPARLLVVYDVVVKTPDVPQVPLIINYGTPSYLSTYPLYSSLATDLPKAVEEYAHRYGCNVLSVF